jgi:hypothetical protein
MNGMRGESITHHVYVRKSIVVVYVRSEMRLDIACAVLYASHIHTVAKGNRVSEMYCTYLGTYLPCGGW